MTAAARCVSHEWPRWIGITPHTDAPYRNATTIDAAIARRSRRISPATNT